MNNVKVIFSSKHKYEDKTEETKYQVPGMLSPKVGYNRLTFIDPSGEVACPCTIIFNKDEIHLTRNGEVLNEMNFYRKSKSFGFYEINEMSLELNIFLKDYVVKEDLIKIDYDLYIDNVNSGFFTIKIKIEELKNENS